MRVRFSAPRGAYARVRFLDSLHGALVNAWTTCGAPGVTVVGREASNWSFGAVGAATSRGFVLKSVVVGTEGESLEPVLEKLLPETVRKRSTNGDVVDLAAWRRLPTNSQSFANRENPPCCRRLCCRHWLCRYVVKKDAGTMTWRKPGRTFRKRSISGFRVLPAGTCA